MDPARAFVEEVLRTLDAAGRESLEEATALLGAIGDRALADLRAATELARDSQG